MAGSGLAHYVKADELLAEIEASPAISKSETETSLATRAVAHAVLAAAAAIVLSSSGADSRAWRETAGTTYTDPSPPNLSRASRGQHRLAPWPASDDCSPWRAGSPVTAQCMLGRPRWEATARSCGVAAKVLHYPTRICRRLPVLTSRLTFR